ncbi:MAG: hypothetical protein HY840_13870 [Bacteroidetes bacterium]|nr:hypothetical protein [Bacteroidota bacterium]
MRNSNQFFKILLISIFAIAILFTVYSFYAYLSQYPTADQLQFTLPRFMDFFKDINSVTVSDGSNLSFIFVGFPGRLINHLFFSGYQSGDLISGNFYYTAVLPYMIVQVTLSLILLFYCIHMIGKISGLTWKTNFLYYLFITLIFLNYPILIGGIKVFKYDALSIPCSIAAILNYILFIKGNKISHLVLSIVFIAFAIIEKDTTFITFFIILFFEIIFILFQKLSLKIVFIRLSRRLLLIFAVFFGTVFLLVPQFWLNPLKIFMIFKNIAFLTKEISVVTIIYLLFASVIGFIVIRALSFQKETVLKRISEIKTARALKILFIFFILIFISSVFFQENNMIGSYYADGAVKNKIASGEIYSTPEIAQVSITTMDKSSFLTRLKISYNMFRLFVYSAPELIVLLFFASPLFFLWAQRKKIFHQDKLLPYLILFPLISFISYFALMPPINSRYLLPLYLLIMIFVIYFSVRILLSLQSNKFVYISLFCLLALTLRPMIAAYPYYLGYMSFFRSSTVENKDYLDMNTYSEWTWLGWGETAHPCFKYIEEQSKGETKVLYDYINSWVSPKRFGPLYSAQGRNRYMTFGYKELKNMLTQLKEGKIEYIQISKNVAYRGVPGNYIMNNYRKLAAFTDKVCGVEYGWVFRTDDLLKAVQ